MRMMENEKAGTEKKCASLEQDLEKYRAEKRKLQQDLSAAEKELKKIMQAEERRLSTNQEIETQTYYKTFEVAIQTEFKVPGTTLKQSNAIQDYPTSIGRGSQRLP